MNHRNVPTLLGQGHACIPTGGKIRAGIKVLTKKVAVEPKAIYEQGVAAGHSFEQIERAVTEALPDLKTPLVPRNVPWFTVRVQDFPNPEIALYLAQHAGRHYQTLFSDEADGALEPERKRMFMAMKREVLHLGGYEQEFFISQTPQLTAMADRVIDLDALHADRWADTRRPVEVAYG